MKSWKRKTRFHQKRQLRISSEGENPNNKDSPRACWALKGFGHKYTWGGHPWGLKLFRKQYDLRKKNDRKYVAKVMGEFKKSLYVEDCRYHPCLVDELTPEPERGDVSVLCHSIVDDVKSNCSYCNCGITHLTEQQAFERRDFIIKYGMYAYQMKYIYKTNDPYITIREMLEMEKQFGFNTNKASLSLTHHGVIWFKETYDVAIEALAYEIIGYNCQ